MRPLVKTWSLQIAGDVKRLAVSLVAAGTAWLGVVAMASMQADSTPAVALLAQATPAFTVIFALLLFVWRESTIVTPLSDSLAATALLAGAGLMVTLLVTVKGALLQPAVASLVPGMAVAAMTGAAFASRVFAQLLVSPLVRPHLVRNVAIYGVCPDTRRVHQAISASHVLRYAGLFDDRRERARLTDPEALIDGGTTELLALIASGSIDEIVITLPPTATERIADIARRLQQYPVDVHICTHVSADVPLGAEPARTVRSLGPASLMEVQRRPIRDWGVLVKTLEDRILGGAMLLLLSPLFFVIALAIKLDSPGPVFFRQRRHGVSGQSIVVWKFRTMHVQENGPEVKQATKGDPRVTSVGRILRATSLDELPQLINVLTGEMSLVGPRPHAVAHNEYYEKLIASYPGRNRVKPGITGWAQINGLRGETQTPELMARRVEHDIWYIRNWSLWLDLKILALTPVYGLIHKNAY